MKIIKFSQCQICVARESGQVIMRTIVDDTPERHESLKRWIERYNKRKGTQ